MNYNKEFSINLPSYSRDPKGFYKKALVDVILNKYPELSVEGLDSPFTGKSLEYVGPRGVIEFGKSRTHDISVGTYSNTFMEYFNNSKGIDLISNWEYAMQKIENYANSKKRREDYYYTTPKVEVYDLFFKIGTTIIPRIPVNLTKVQITVVREFLLIIG